RALPDLALRSFPTRRSSDLEPCLRVVRHRRNLGKGAAVRTAIKHMTGDVAVVQDADLEYNPVDIPRLLAPILSGEADAVFGTRLDRKSTRLNSSHVKISYAV